jgi:hypothetical protein
MSQRRLLAIGLISLAVIPAELVFGFAFWFSPGWANRWPGGLPITLVWPAGLSLLLFLTLMTAVTAACTLLLGAVKNPPRLRERGQMRLLATWELLAALAVTPLVIGAFMALQETAARMWPNGYNP